MTNDPSHNNESIDELLKQYNNLKNGYGSVFFEEEAFEKIIDYFDEQEDLSKALEAAETAIEYYPFSAPFLLRKADLFWLPVNTKKPWPYLEKAELFDATDINLYILKTDAYLAMDMQEKAVELLEEAFALF